MALIQGSTLYAGSVSEAAVYEIMQGEGLTWASHFRTEVLLDGKPRQLTRGIHAGDPITENMSAPRDADFGAAATVTIDGRQISVSPLMVRDKVDILDYKETFPQYQPSGSNNNLAVNPVVAQTFFNLVMDATKNQLNTLHSIGDTGAGVASPLRFYNGVVTQFQTDADATEIGTPAVLTGANILARVYELRNAVPPRLRTNASLKIFCSWADFDLYDVARRQSQTQLAETDIEGSGVLRQSNGSRINLIPIEGIPKDLMFATIADTSAKSNLVQAVWMLEDLEALKVYKSEEADQEIKYVMRFDLGVNYVTGKDIFYIDKA
jgi:hypothetical protein